MEKTWDVTIMKMGSIQINAETEEEAIEKAEELAIISTSVNWEDSWNAVDANIVSKSLYR
ncbi:MAG: hypothetical protein NC413_10620 [Muribaculum sp.]|nr:hypothetical protein [Muribaculum sp.]